MNSHGKKILLVEVDDTDAGHYTSVLEHGGFSVIRASSGKEAVELADQIEPVDLILAEIDLGAGMDGPETVSLIQQKREIPAIFFSTHTEENVINRISGAGLYGYVLKSSGDAVLMLSIAMAFRLYEAHSAINTQKEELEAAYEELQAALEEAEAGNQELIATQKDLANSESELNSLFDALLVGVGMIVDRKFRRVNNYLCNLLGYDENELVGNFTKIIYADDNEYERAGRELYGMMFRVGHGITKAAIRHKDGTILVGLISLTPIDPDNMDAGICATINDITELNLAEQALRESELKFKSVMEQSTLPMIILDTAGTLIDKNEAWSKLLGFDSENMPGQYNILNDEQIAHLIKYIGKAFAGESADLPEYPYRIVISEENSTVLWLTGRAYPLKDVSGNVNNVVMIIEDITERKRVDEALRLSEEKFRTIYETMNVGFFRTGLDGSIIDVNPACLRMFGFNTVDEARDFLNNRSEGIYADKNDWERVRKNITSGNGHFESVVRLSKADGEEFRGSIDMRIIRSSDGSPLYIEGILEDVTEREKTQAIIIQSEKMITVAGLAAGMAHEINNPLGIIMQNSENALHRILDDLPANVEAALAAGTDFQKIRAYVTARRIDKYLIAIIDAGSRAAKIVSNMLKFSRGTESKFDYLNINTIIDKSLDLASNDYDLKKNYDFKNIRIIKEYGNLPDIPCAETQIEQVLLNLFKNAAQAMYGDISMPALERSITVKTSQRGGFVKIEISDNGPGMDEVTKKRVFEPFFSAGKTGIGTGLGLSVSYHIIVTAHGGTISVESVPGEGTKFIILLPVDRRGH